MPKVGDITFDVNIDAKNLGARLTEAVHRAVKPALASLDKQLAGAGGKGWAGQPRDDLGRWMKQANKDVDAHVKKLQTYHGVMGQLNRMLDTFTAKALLMTSTLSPVIGLLGGAIGVLGGGIGGLVGGIGALTAGMAALGPAIAGVVGALKIGFAGLKEGAKAYLAQFEDANKVMAAQIGNMMGPMLTAWQEVSSRIKLDFAQALVPTFNNLGALLRTLGPGLSAVGQAFAGIANNVTATLNALAPQLNTILEGSRQFLAGIGPGIQALTAGFVNMGAAAQKAMPAIAAGFRSAMEQVAASWNQIAASPQFQQALQAFGQIISQIGGLLAGLGPVMVDIGAKAGPVFAGMISALGDSLKILLTAVGDIGMRVGPIFNQFLAALGPALASVVYGLGQMGEIVGPTLIPLLNTLAAALQPLYVPLAQLGKVLAEQLIAILPTISQGLAQLIGPITLALPALGTLINMVAQIIVASGPALVALAQAMGAVAQGLVAGLTPLLPVINQMATALAPFITQLGTTLAGVLVDLGPIIADLTTQIVQFLVPNLPGLIDLLEATLQIFVQLADALTNIPGGVEGVIVAFAAWKSITAVDWLLTQLMAVSTTLRTTLPESAAIGGAGITAGLAKVAIPLWLATLIEKEHPNFPIQDQPTGQQRIFPGWVPILPFWEDQFRNQNQNPGQSGYVETSPGVWQKKENVPGIGGGAAPLPFSSTGAGGGPNAQRERRGAGPIPPPATPPTLFAPQQPYTPVAPDIKGAAGPKGPGGQPLTADDLPLDALAQTPEQVKLLKSIRDLLAGTGSQSPLNKLKDIGPAVSDIAQRLKKHMPDVAYTKFGATPPRMGPYGTPIPAQNPIGYQVESAVIQALGGDVEAAIGESPVKYAEEQWADQVDSLKESLDNQTNAWKDATDQWLKSLKAAAPQLTPQQQAALPGMPPGWQPTNLPTPGGGLNWQALAGAEAGGNWANKTNPKYMGGLQFDQATWDAYKPPGAPNNPADATMEQQIAAGQAAMAARGGPQTLWPQNWQKLYEGTNLPVGSVPHGTGALPGPVTAPGLPGANIATMGSPIPVWVVGSGPMPATTASPGALPGAAAIPGGGGTYGLPAGTDIRQGAPGFPDWVYQLGQQYGLKASTYAGHQATNRPDIGALPNPQGLNRGIDWWGEPANMAAFAKALADSGIAEQVIYGGFGGPVGYPANVDYSGDYPAHGGHVHTRFGQAPGGLPAGTPTGMPATAPGLPGPNLATTSAAVPVLVTNWPGQPITPGAPGQPSGNLPGAIAGGIAGAGIEGLSQAAQNVTNDALGAIGQIGLEEWTARQPNAPLDQLVKEGNPLAFAAAAGFNVQDFTRQGGAAGPVAAPAQPFDASGRMFGDTAGLLDRTFTSLTAQLDAMRQQLLDVLEQVKQKVSEEVLRPIIESAIRNAMDSMKASTMQTLGTQVGKGAAPPIADAVNKQIDQSTSGGGGVGPAVQNLGEQGLNFLMDEGGILPTGGTAINLSGSPELVLNPAQTRALTQFATGPGVIGNDLVGAEFLGVSQIPIIGMIVNIITRVILKMLGVQIEVRDTLGELSSDFRTFRGDAFKVFDAQGRLLNDTSGLIDRSLSSEREVADERIRILKIVIAALVKYIIEKVIVPIAKAVAQTLINAAAQAAGTAVTAGINSGAAAGGASAGPAGAIAGSAVAGAISSGGQAAIDIISEIGTDLGVALADVGTDAIFSGMMSAIPNIMTQLFSGMGFFNLFTALFGNLFGGIFGSIAAFGTVPLAAAVLPTGTGLFDDGGVAAGSGLMPKATLEPERVLSGRQTVAFERFVDALESGQVGSTRTVHAPMSFHVSGGREAADQAHDRLLALMS